MADSSFDIVSKTDKTELLNAINLASTEIRTRFDFKGSKSSIEHKDNSIVIISDDESKLKQVIDVLISKMAKRNVGLKAFNFESKIEPASTGTVRMKVPIQEGLEKDQVKELIKFIKDSNLKVQVTGMGDAVRVTGKKKDDLQTVIQAIKKHDFKFECQFTNFK